MHHYLRVASLTRFPTAGLTARQEPLLILFVSGVFDCFQVAASGAFLTAAPVEQRSQVFGLAQAGMSLGQGAAMIVAGAIAQHHSPSTAIAVIGGFGALAAAVISADRAT